MLHSETQAAERAPLEQVTAEPDQLFSTIESNSNMPEADILATYRIMLTTPRIKQFLERLKSDPNPNRYTKFLHPLAKSIGNMSSPLGDSIFELAIKHGDKELPKLLRQHEIISKENVFAHLLPSNISMLDTIKSLEPVIGLTEKAETAREEELIFMLNRDEFSFSRPYDINQHGKCVLSIAMRRGFYVFIDQAMEKYEGDYNPGVLHDAVIMLSKEKSVSTELYDIIMNLPHSLDYADTQLQNKSSVYLFLKKIKGKMKNAPNAQTIAAAVLTGQIFLAKDWLLEFVQQGGHLTETVRLPFQAYGSDNLVYSYPSDSHYAISPLIDIFLKKASEFYIPTIMEGQQPNNCMGRFIDALNEVVANSIKAILKPQLTQDEINHISELYQKLCEYPEHPVWRIISEEDEERMENIKNEEAAPAASVAIPGAAQQLSTAAIPARASHSNVGNLEPVATKAMKDIGDRKEKESGRERGN
jgi:hypothetical protein